ncbi:hypothetical protein WG922_09620 [Ramlibacter sp. AN1015]|uniref:hypothetical protein n=1 Tax=Ramlibacter sp. AN1015 TaxID=3133428 RepID=UPI0030BE10AB
MVDILFDGDDEALVVPAATGDWLAPASAMSFFTGDSTGHLLQTGRGVAPDKPGLSELKRHRSLLPPTGRRRQARKSTSENA